ncbi:MAG: universal stress protein [Bacteroidetes bacterium]|nr:MAG: universal stress protein [Bacteroidota bacterium]
MKEILVPVNLRADFENLLAYAKSVAIRTEARLTFFYTGTRRLLKGKGPNEYESTEDAASFYRRIRSNEMRGLVRRLFEESKHAQINFRFRYHLGSNTRGIIRECKSQHYDLLILGTHEQAGLRGFVHQAMASRIMGEVNTPVLVVPISSSFSQIEHITYATDLSDYDPNIIKQIKSIAAIFDARLTIAHVNIEQNGQNEAYLNSLEKTISDTLDYPKVYYKFFDHADPLGGIQKFVKQNDTHLLAMINRKKFRWSELFSPKSLTRKMARNMTIPVLAFSKPSS